MKLGGAGKWLAIGLQRVFTDETLGGAKMKDANACFFGALANGANHLLWGNAGFRCGKLVDGSQVSQDSDPVLIDYPEMRGITVNSFKFNNDEESENNIAYINFTVDKKT